VTLASHSVGWPGFLALAVGCAAFGVAFLAARARRGPRDSGGRRANASILWIILQGVGIFLAGAGPVHWAADRWSAQSWETGAVVLALMAAATALFDWTTRTMGRNWALVARTRGDASLVTTGPFAYVRNPIYVALALFMIALAIASGHEARLLIAFPVYALATMLRVRLEERVLRAEFGSAYNAYAARTKRFFPGLI